MERVTLLLSHWVEILDTLLWHWSAEQLARLERDLHALLPGLAAHPSVLLKELRDESLALAIQKGFLLKPAFEELFVHRYSDFLTCWFRSWGTEANQLFDLRQQLYLNFFQKRLHGFQPNHSFGAYLRKSAYHLWVQMVTRARRPCDLAAIAPPEDGGASPEQMAAGKELEEKLAAILPLLPPEQAQVLRCAMNGQTADEIAHALGIDKRVVFMRLFHARRRVERHLGMPARCAEDHDRGC